MFIVKVGNGKLNIYFMLGTDHPLLITTNKDVLKTTARRIWESTFRFKSWGGMGYYPTAIAQQLLIEADVIH